MYNHVEKTKVRYGVEYQWTTRWSIKYWWPVIRSRKDDPLWKIKK
jgi:hypothetical protein